MRFLFYSLPFDRTSYATAPKEGLSPEDKYRIHVWSPKSGPLTPRGLHLVPFGVWWVFHQIRVFANQGYRIAVIYDRDILVHRSCVFPRYFRFPFMGAADLQVGDTWTHPDYRGQGLATSAIRRIVATCQQPGRTFWYVVERENFASIRVIEKAGFQLTGEGDRIKRLGVGMLGAYVIQQPITTWNSEEI